jgi:hypothetical protein
VNSNHGIRFGLTCKTRNVTQTFAPEKERAECASRHSQCDVELIRMITR